MAKYMIAVDQGNSKTKSYYKGNGKEVKFSTPTGYTAQYEDGGFQYGGRNFVFDKRVENDSDKTGSQRMMICTLNAIGKTLSEIGADSSKIHTIDLVVDVPINSWTKEEKEKYIDYYRGKAETFGYADREWKVRFENVNALPQGLSIYVSNRKKFSGYSTTNIIDIGGGTIDVVVLMFRNGERIGMKKFGVDLGTNTLTQAVISELRQRNIVLSVEEIETAISRNDISNKRRTEIMDVIKENLDDYVTNVCNTLQARGLNLDNPTEICCGGAAMLEKELSEKMYVIGIDDEFANVEAIYKCAKVLSGE